MSPTGEVQVPRQSSSVQRPQTANGNGSANAKQTRQPSAANGNNASAAQAATPMAQRSSTLRVLPYQPSVKIDSKGNLTLFLGSENMKNGPRKVLVSRQRVRDISPAWSKTIRSHWLWWAKEVSLTDDPEMVILIMRIAHSDFSELKGRKLSFNELLQLSIVSYKYTTNHLLMLVAEDWLLQHRTNILKPGHEQWLFIAFQFGLEEDYTKLAHHLALNCKVDKDGNLLAPGTNRHMTGVFPHGALNQIRHVRTKTLTQFLMTLYGHLNAMIEQNTCLAPHNGGGSAASGAPASEQTECTLLNHSSMIRHLKSSGYWPQREAKDVPESLADVAQALTTVQVTPWRARFDCLFDSIQAPPSKDPSNTMLNKHEQCNASVTLATKIQGVLDNMENPVEEAVLTALRVNGVRLNGPRDAVQTKVPKNRGPKELPTSVLQEKSEEAK